MMMNKDVIKKEDTVEQTNSVIPKQAEALEISPTVDIVEDVNGATIYVDLPGVSKESLDIDMEKDVLTIKGNINLHTPHELNVAYMDLHAGNFVRKFTLSSELDAANIEASLSNGELKLFIPRSESHKPRKIEIKAA